MKKIALYTTAASLLFAVACNQPQAEAEATQEEQNSEEVAEVGEAMEADQMEESENPKGSFGRVIEAEGAVTMDEFSSLIEGKDSVQVKLLAVAEDVCQKKGCWMKVKTADGELMRVRFKDYGFFVPKDLSGKKVVFEGVAYKDTTSVEDLRHYAEDGGQSPEEIAAIVEPEINTSFMADGVVIVE